MNKRQSNKLNSYQSIKGVLEDNRPIYEPVPIINQSVENFFKVVNEVDAIATRTEMDTTGETSAKIVAKEKLATLASSLEYTYSDLRYARDTEALQISSAIELELLDNQAELTEYLVTDQDLANLRQLIDDFENSLETRGGVKSGSVAETRRLSILFRVADDLLTKKLDRFVVRLKPDYPTFFDAYRNARMIVDL